MPLFLRELERFIEENPAINSLRFTEFNTPLSPEELEQLALFIQRHRQVIVLDLAFQNLREASVPLLYDLTHLRSLSLAGNAIRPRTIILMLNSLTQLSSLNLSFNETIDASLIKKITQHPTLTKLHLDNTGFNNLHAEQLARHPKLHFLSVKNHHLTETGVCHLLRIQTLQTLNLSIQANIRWLLASQNVGILIALHKQLKQLNLSGIAIGTRFLNMITQNHGLQSLKLKNTLLTDEHVKLLAFNGQFKHLDISHNDYQFESLADFLKNEHIIRLESQLYYQVPQLTQMLERHITINHTLSRHNTNRANVTSLYRLHLATKGQGLFAVKDLNHHLHRFFCPDKKNKTSLKPSLSDWLEEAAKYPDSFKNYSEILKLKSAKMRAHHEIYNKVILSFLLLVIAIITTPQTNMVVPMMFIGISIGIFRDATSITPMSNEAIEDIISQDEINNIIFNFPG